jgi:hypothetical protein
VQDRHNSANVARAHPRSVFVFGGNKLKNGNIFSLTRMQTEVLDSFAVSPPPPPAAAPEYEGKIGLTHATFTWSAPDVDSAAAGCLQLRPNDAFEFRRGALNLVFDPTGSGNSALLLALLGELYDVTHGPDSWCGLPQEGSVLLRPCTQVAQWWQDVHTAPMIVDKCLNGYVVRMRTVIVVVSP